VNAQDSQQGKTQIKLFHNLASRGDGKPLMPTLARPGCAVDLNPGCGAGGGAVPFEYLSLIRTSKQIYLSHEARRVTRIRFVLSVPDSKRNSIIGSQADLPGV
jgi:hypothetical protein